MAIAQTTATVAVNIDPARMQALHVASEMVDGWTAQVKNERGYVHDKWKPVDLKERTEAVLQLAGFLLTSPHVGKLAAPIPSSTLFGWPLSGEAGPPTQQQYKVAKEIRDAWANDGLPHKAVEVDALHQMIDAYEATLPATPPAP